MQPATQPSVYLTFDDGPDPVHTPALLDVLAGRAARATFFQVGKDVERHPELTRRVSREGHVVGNHSWSHPDLSQLDAEAGADELARTSALLTEVLGRPPTLFRPPYGRVGVTTEPDARGSGLETVLWDIDTMDWDCPGVDAIVGSVLDGATDGAIVLLHDGGGDRSQTVAAVDQIIAALAPQGFAFAALPVRS